MDHDTKLALGAAAYHRGLTGEELGAVLALADELDEDNLGSAANVMRRLVRMLRERPVVATLSVKPGDHVVALYSTMATMEDLQSMGAWLAKLPCATRMMAREDWRFVVVEAADTESTAVNGGGR
jgi:hypothetical protein